MTPKQARFVDEYLLDLNATQAAIRAGYSAKTAKAIGCENLRKLQIADAIAEAQAARAQRVQIDADWVLERMVAEAEADLADLFDDNGALLPVTQWPLIWRQGLVSGLDVDETFLEGENIGRTTKIKLSERIKRIELIGKHTDVKAFNGHRDAPGVTNNLTIEVDNLTVIEQAKIVIQALRLGAAASKQQQEKIDG